MASESGKGHNDAVLAALLTTREHETERSMLTVTTTLHLRLSLLNETGKLPRGGGDS